MQTNKPTSRRTYIWLAVAFVAGLLASGSQIWPGSYIEYLDRGQSRVYELIAVTAFLVPIISGLGIPKSALAVGFGCPAATFIRVVADGIRDPTSHNLWPFEVAIALVLGMAVAWPSAAIGRLLRYLFVRVRSKPKGTVPKP